MRFLKRMAYKLTVLVVLLLCIVGTMQARKGSVKIGEGNIKSSGWFGKKRDYNYHVPYGAVAVTLDEHDQSSSSHSFGSGTGGATVSWTPGSRTARVHAWVNGKVCVWGCSSNHISWTVYAHF